ncbi:hypothetical protein BOTBODRAFT_142625 [Botryobasidium botryosum FD-172 SS1]|uniref:Major facilitator superfamily (MFS) profile domain-containing protein n=1 Tax=Botryobasidium botryosum (strain FD-172 SS1) TaxID=930990 RepID=A0A067N890_BOTB1|nr:hypothetical protein BOTBODRAFT_142625 [Botryobasidium botryosum FD-172 SS1]
MQREGSQINVTDAGRAEVHAGDVDGDDISTTSSIEGQEPRVLGTVNTKEENTVESSLPAKDVDLAFPDGGLRAWLVVTGAVCVSFSTFGFVNAWGVFQTYYQETLLKDQSPSTIAWIGSLQYSLVFFPGLITGRLFDIGHLRLITVPASILHVIAVFLTAECKTYWQFLLCQGLAIGITSGLLWGPAIPVVSHWFLKKRSRVYGVVAIGSSIGGTVLPIATRKLIPLVGFRWTVRILGFILLGMLTIANLTMRRRLPARPVDGGLLNLRAFKFAPYTIWCISTIFTLLGLYTCLTYIDVAAASIGVNPDLSFYLISIANAASLVGRISSGFLADKFGPLNVLIPVTLLAGVMTYIWPYMTNFGSLVAIALIYGCSSGAFVSLIPSPVAQMGDTHDIGRRVGMCLTIMAVGGLTGPPISGAIRDASGGFHDVGFYAGSVVLCSCLLMAGAKWAALGTVFTGKY